MARSGQSGSVGGSAGMTLTSTAIASALGLAIGGGAIALIASAAGSETAQSLGQGALAIVADASAGQAAKIGVPMYTLAADLGGYALGTDPSATNQNGVLPSTTIASGSNGQQLGGTNQTINVASTTNFSTANTLQIAGGDVLVCTGKTSNQFTGCSGGSSILATGQSVVTGIDCVGTANCGPSRNAQCCMGLERRAFNATGVNSSTCNTVFGVGRGTLATEVTQSDGTKTARGPQWVKQSAISATIKMIDDYGTTRVDPSSAGVDLAVASTFNVISTAAGFVAPTNTLQVTSSNGVQTLHCTTLTATSFGGCTGGTGVLAANAHVEDLSVQPAGLPSLGNAFEFEMNTNDERFFLSIGRQATDPACAAGTCDDPAGSDVDVNGDPMILGSPVLNDAGAIDHYVYYFGAKVWFSDTADTSTFRSCHTVGGEDLLTACGQGKKLENLQLLGDNNNSTKSGILRTCNTATCPNGPSSASNFFFGSTLGVVAHQYVYKFETSVSDACTSPDESSPALTVSCAAGVHNALTMWIDTPSVGHGVDPGSPAVSASGHTRIVNERSSNNRQHTGIVCSGNTNNRPMRLSRLVMLSKDYDGVVNPVLQ